MAASSASAAVYKHYPDEFKTPTVHNFEYICFRNLLLFILEKVYPLHLDLHFDLTPKRALITLNTTLHNLTYFYCLFIAFRLFFHINLVAC